MNIDNPTFMATLDTHNMLDEIDGLPDQLQTAYQLGMEQPLPDWQDIEKVVIAGMGGSAIGGSLAAAFTSSTCRVPVIVHRDYDLPAWAYDPHTLVVPVSHSGNTEETLSSFQAAIKNNCRVVAVTTGGKLADFADSLNIPLWRFNHSGQPRAAVGLSFGFLLALLHRTGLIPSREADINNTVREMKNQQEELRGNVPAANNPAKQLAISMQGKWVSVFGAGVMAPVARRWKGQISEVSKAWAQFEALPEADHNTLAGVVNPASLLAAVYTVFLNSETAHPRNQLRTTLTLGEFQKAGLPGTVIHTPGRSALSQMWTTLHLGDYCAFYLAMLYGVDPTPVAAIQNLKKAMRDQS